MLANNKALDLAEQDFGVDRQVITAILLVETRLGAYVGNRLVINTFSTMAALSDPAVRKALWSVIKGNTSLTRAQFEAKALKKSSWAYGELKSFLVYTKSTTSTHLPSKGLMPGHLATASFCRAIS